MLHDKLSQASSVARVLLDEYDLSEWQIVLNNSYTDLARTWYDDKKIVISKRFVSVATKEQFVGVLAHEIAHVLVGHGYGHGEKFIEVCTAISGDSKYAVEGFPIYTSMFVRVCECGDTVYTNKKGPSMCLSCLDKGFLSGTKATKNSIELVRWES